MRQMPVVPVAGFYSIDDLVMWVEANYPSYRNAVVGGDFELSADVDHVPASEVCWTAVPTAEDLEDHTGSFVAIVFCPGKEVEFHNEDGISVSPF